MQKVIALCVVGFGIAISIVLASKLSSPISYKRDMISAGSAVASALFVVAAFLERTLAIINSLIFGAGKNDAENELIIQTNPDLRNKAITKLKEIQTGEEQVRIAVGFLFSLLISAAGVRALGGLLDVPSPIPDNQIERYTFFNWVDVLLTAGLLAGGSNGLAMIVELLKKAVQTKIAELKGILRPASAPPAN